MTAPSTDRTRLDHIRLADMRQKLQAPASALAEYADLLLASAAGPAFDDLREDFERIHTATQTLLSLVGELLDAETLRQRLAEHAMDDVEKELRHDLRTPINAIQGYGEMLLEDLEDGDDGGLSDDLEALLAESRNLLSQLDVIVSFGLDGGERAPDADGGVTSEMLTGLIESIRPLGPSEEPEALKGHILVVDDMEQNRALLRRRLEREGHSVALANSGPEALALAAEQDFDLILLDLMMPEMNGFEVLTRLKAETELQHISVIMVSALDEIDSALRCIEAGAEDYLPKPINPTLLKARLHACLEKRQWRAREQRYLRQLNDEKEKYERLLLNILPPEIVGRLSAGETVIADRYEEVSVLFSDLVGFTALSGQLPPSQVVDYLNQIFTAFDELAQENGVEKIKMIGDAYMVVAGVPLARPDHVEAITRMARQMFEALERINDGAVSPCSMRIGIHSGPVVAGVIGSHKFVYDVWGDTVNVASRLEGLSLPGRVQVSESTARRLGELYHLERRGELEVKGKGRMQTYFLGEPKDPGDR
jgi:class 3 adenylate cyclase